MEHTRGTEIGGFNTADIQGECLECLRLRVPVLAQEELSCGYGSGDGGRIMNYSTRNHKFMRTDFRLNLYNKDRQLISIQYALSKLLSAVNWQSGSANQNSTGTIFRLSP